MRLRAFFTTLFCSMLASVSWASTHPPLAPDTPALVDAPRYILSLGVGGGRYADDGVTSVTPGFHLRIGDARIGKSGKLFGMDSSAPFALDLRAPMNFTVVDRGITDGFWRKSEYDQPSEFLSILERLEFGRPDGPLYLRAGVLSDIRLGHGTILDRYGTNYGYDYRRWGMLISLQSPTIGGTFLFDDLLRPGLYGGRVYIAPWATGDGGARAFSFGVSLVGDVRAPRAMSWTLDGELEFDAHRRPMVDNAGSVTMVGFDVEALAVDTLRTRLTFYSDVNLMFPNTGVGWHTGGFLSWKSGDVSVFSLRGEFRLSGDGYLPGYFSKLYEISRLRVASSHAGPQPLYSFRDEHAVGGLRTGYLASVRWDHTAVGVFEAGVEGGSGRFDEAFFLRYLTPEHQLVRAALHYELPWIESWQRVDIFRQAYLAAELQVSITPWLAVWASGGRRWRQSEAADFSPQTEVQGGATFYYAFPR